VRLRGRAPRGVRVIGAVPLGRWETITFVAALRHNKMVAPMVVKGAMTGEMFLAYVENCLVPTLRRNDIVVMDNCRVHLGTGIGRAIETVGATLRYLPKYSPDLNPIEMPYSKFKTFLRKVHQATCSGDFAPGYDSETFFKDAFTKASGQVIESIRVPLQNPDFAPFLQRAADVSPDGLFVFVPAGQAGALIRQFVQRGLDKSGVRLFGAGDITDDDLLNGMGDAVIGTVTAYFYSAAHPSEKNKAFVDAFKKANNGMRPNFFAVSGYDGMHLIYEALKKTNGSTNGDVLVTAMKGMAWESPRGPIAIDPETRDIVQNIYLRKVEKVNGELYNIEFETYEAVKDPVKAAKK
jgi:transposase